MATHQCPHCGSSNVRASYKRRSDLLHVVYRCRNCKRHFTARKSRGQLLTLAGLVALLAVVAGYALYLIGQSDNGSETAAQVEPFTILSEQDRLLAKQGDAEAQYRMGMDLWSASDFQKAFPWLKNAADKGHVEARYNLGMAYLYGRGTVQNFRYALEQFQKAAQSGHLDAQYTLGTMYRDGLGVASNKEIAYTWLNVAAARGHDIAASDRDRLSMMMDSEQMLRSQEASIKELNKQLGTAEATPSPEAGLAQEPPAGEPQAGESPAPQAAQQAHPPEAAQPAAPDMQRPPS